MNHFVVKNGKKLRFGYTTGSCATAAAKGAARMLITGEKIDQIQILSPKGWTLDLSLQDIYIEDNIVRCSVIKDSGDDPDITNGIKIYAEVEKINEDNIYICGGIGVGKVTKPGLAIPVGEYAINPTPRKTIIDGVSEELPKGVGVKITISIPEGVDIAKKTFNPKLGIEGGISVLGTTGIVEPMSEEAFKDSLALELSMLKEQGIKKVIFSPGNYGRDFLNELSIKEYSHVKTSNFIGFMLDKAVEYEIEEILWIGHIGKMIKVAGGIFHTHSKIADARMEILASRCALIGAPQSLIQKIFESTTTDEAIQYIVENNMERVFYDIANKISYNCEMRTYKEVKIGTVIFSRDHGLLSMCSTAREMLEEYENE